MCESEREREREREKENAGGRARACVYLILYAKLHSISPQCSLFSAEGQMLVVKLVFVGYRYKQVKCVPDEKLLRYIYIE